MRKIISIVISLSLSASLLIGCGKDEPVAEVPQDELQQEMNDLQQVQDFVADTLVEETEEAMNDIKEDIEQSEAERAEAEANAQTINVTDNKIYDKDGVLITLDSISNLKASITVKNDNHDNKKIRSLYLSYVGLNGICPSTAMGGAIQDIPVGGTGTIDVDLNYCTFHKDLVFNYDESMDSIVSEPLVDRMQKTYSKLGASNIPIETVDFDFELTLGESDPIVERIHSSLHTDKYKDGELSSYWGDLKDSLEFELDEADKYIGRDPEGPLDVYVNSDRSASGVFSIIFAGKYDTGIDYELTDTYLYINNREYNCFHRNPTIRGNGFIDVFTFEKDPTTIRQEFEIPNSDPVEIKVMFKKNGEEHYYDLGTLPPQ